MSQINTTVHHHHDQPDEDEGDPDSKQLAPVGLGDGGGHHGGEDHEKTEQDENDPRMEGGRTRARLVPRQRNIFVGIFLKKGFLHKELDEKVVQNILISLQLSEMFVRKCRHPLGETQLCLQLYRVLVHSAQSGVERE